MTTTLLEVISRAEAGQATFSDALFLLERMQQEIDWMSELLDNLPPVSFEVQVRINGIDLTFESVDHMAKWTAGER